MSDYNIKLIEQKLRKETSNLKERKSKKAQTIETYLEDWVSKGFLLYGSRNNITVENILAKKYNNSTEDVIVTATKSPQVALTHALVDMKHSLASYSKISTHNKNNYHVIIKRLHEFTIGENGWVYVLPMEGFKSVQDRPWKYTYNGCPHIFMEIPVTINDFKYKIIHEESGRSNILHPKKAKTALKQEH